MQEEGAHEDSDDDGENGNATSYPTYEPKPPERSPAPAIFKAWRQDNYGTMMMQAWYTPVHRGTAVRM